MPALAFPSDSVNPENSARSSNPALDAFVPSVHPEKVWAQILVQRVGNTFTLCHVADCDAPTDELKRLSLPELRKVAMFTASGQFRPLRSSPDLPRGWTMTCHSAAELWRALQELYPGSIPDWFAAQSPRPPVTNYRDFTHRQSGMYRITQLLSDEQAANVTRAACHSRFCLKQRLWTVAELATDSAADKSAIPCLEPCAILLELARKAARIEQEEKIEVQLSASELQSFLAAAENALGNLPADERTANVADATNPRRLQLLLEKFKKYAATERNPINEEL